jgi:hypothetical protein
VRRPAAGRRIGASAGSYSLMTTMTAEISTQITMAICMKSQKRGKPVTEPL